MEQERNVILYDTTLRDGTQGEQVNFSAEEKLRVARKLDELGFHYIEGGWPGSNPEGHAILRACPESAILKMPGSRLSAAPGNVIPGRMNARISPP